MLLAAVTTGEDADESLRANAPTGYGDGFEGGGAEIGSIKESLADCQGDGHGAIAL